MAANGRRDLIRRLNVKYIKSVLWRVAKRLSYIGDAQCLKWQYRPAYVLVSQHTVLLSFGVILVPQEHRQVSDTVLGYNTRLTKHKPGFNKPSRTSQILPQLAQVCPLTQPKHVGTFIKWGAIDISTRVLWWASLTAL